MGLRDDVLDRAKQGATANEVLDFLKSQGVDSVSIHGVRKYLQRNLDRSDGRRSPGRPSEIKKQGYTEALLEMARQGARSNELVSWLAERDVKYSEQAIQRWLRKHLSEEERAESERVWRERGRPAASADPILVQRSDAMLRVRREAVGPEAAFFLEQLASATGMARALSETSATTRSQVAAIEQAIRGAVVGFTLVTELVCE